jgi:hypothetical protein
VKKEPVIPIQPGKPTTTKPPVTTVPSAKPNTDDASGAGQTESFSITQNDGQVDVVWIIDNSGSMGEEAAQVRKNFESFVQSVQSRSDMHVALVSQKFVEGSSESTAVTLPGSAMAAGGRQVDAYVGSNDELSLLAATICAAGTSDVGRDPLGGITLADSLKLCGQSVTGDSWELSQASGAVGQLHDFFRPQAKKVIVVVSDDNAQGVTAANFLDLVRADVGGSDPTVFGFVGLNEQRAGCSIAAVGSAYEELAFKTGGEVFDICDADWSANFGKLGEHVAQLAQSQFTVKMPVGSVTSVTIDGKPVALTAVTAKGSSVEIDPKAIPAGAKSVPIVYKKGA